MNFQVDTDNSIWLRSRHPENGIKMFFGQNPHPLFYGRTTNWSLVSHDVVGHQVVPVVKMRVKIERAEKIVNVNFPRYSKQSLLSCKVYEKKKTTFLMHFSCLICNFFFGPIFCPCCILLYDEAN